MRVLAVTNLYPSVARPADGVFIHEQVRGLRELGLEVEVQFVDRKSLGMRAYYSMLAPLRERIDEFAPHLLHVMYGGVMADRITRKIRGLPTLVTFHGSDLLGENLSGLLRKLISHYGILCSHRAARQADGVVVVSDRLKQALPAGVDAQKLRIIPCGIDLQRFCRMDRSQCRNQLGWKAGIFHVLFPSHRKNSVKRPWLALQAIEQLKSSGVAVELHFMEQLPNTQVPVWMNASDALLLTSAHEGSPTVVKEALGCGLPIVSVDVGDVSERIAGVQGCYLAAPDPRDLASRLQLVQKSGQRVDAPEQLQELSLAGAARHLSAFYQELVGKFQRGSNVQTARPALAGRA